MRHPLLDIPELANLQMGRGLIRIPQEQDVPFTPRVRALVDTAEFQRLGQITQLGLASRVYPGATHTRFEHALGVFHNALRYLWQLGQDERFCKTIDVHMSEVLLAAALLHDLGHWPFCHPIEDMALPELPPHEQFAAEFLSDDREIAQVLRDEWHLDPAEVLDVLVARSESAPFRLMRSILSGPIDIDKMDYLERDSLHAGVPYGRNFDRNRLMQSLVVNAAGDGLALNYKGKTAAEMMVFARYIMFSEVYWHHAVRSATCMFGRGFYELHRALDLKVFFQKSESETIAELRKQAKGTECEALLEGLFGPKRQLYKRVAEFSHDRSCEIYENLAQRPYTFLTRCAERLAERASAELKQRITRIDVIIDAPPQHREVEFRVDIFYPKEGLYRSLQEVSPVVEALAHRQFDDYVKRVRIFAEAACAQRLSEWGGFDACLRAAVEETEAETR